MTTTMHEINPEAVETITLHANGHAGPPPPPEPQDLFPVIESNRRTARQAVEQDASEALAYAVTRLCQAHSLANVLGPGGVLARLTRIVEAEATVREATRISKLEGLDTRDRDRDHR